jgi:glycine cleavage system aminomethyltransferase T
MRIVFENKPIDVQAGDSILLALQRQGIHPTGGGCLCFGGDCANCVATVDGVSYVRTCQTRARPGMVVESHPQDGPPEIRPRDRIGSGVVATNIHCDVVVIGQGRAGREAADEAQAAKKRVVRLDSDMGQEAIGIYYGPMVVARTPEGMLHIHAHEDIIVATGAAEIQAVVPGSGLAGIYTVRAAQKLREHGVELGKTVAVGQVPAGLGATPLDGELLRFEGTDRMQQVVVQTAAGEQTVSCSSAIVGLGTTPRDSLFRMGHDLPVRAVGQAAGSSLIPKCPAEGLICACAQVSVADLEAAWAQGFQDMELVKRATLAGTGTCQGSVCLPYLRGFLAEKGELIQPAFTARPVTRQLTIGEIAAGAHHHPTPRTALDSEHRRLGAQMDRIGGWWRPWNYGDVWAEYWAVREAVSLGDVSTLGKMMISGPDALELLERLYPTRVRTIKTGRSRYVLLLNERGYVMDDGLISKESETRFALTFTSGGSSFAEMWVRDWAASWELDVRILNQTSTLAAINVTGPLSNELLARAGLTEPPGYLRFGQSDVAGVSCQVYRLSFTGERSYELHHAATDSLKLWRALMALGRDLGIKPHGLEALLKLRLEKGHIIVGQDSDFDSTPRRLRHEWAVKLDKDRFVGRGAIIRTNKTAKDKELVGFECDGEPPAEGSIIWHRSEFAGQITSSSYSPVLGKGVMLGWLYVQDGSLPEELMADERSIQRAALPFYDREANRARA